jgi:hypothetical protein
MSSNLIGGTMVGWPSGLGGGLQNLLHQFESDSDLNIRGCGEMVSCGSPKALLWVRILPPVHKVLSFNGLGQMVTDHQMGIRIPPRPHN